MKRIGPRPAGKIALAAVAACVLLGLVATGVSEAAVCLRTITADVVAIDQHVMFNRLGAHNPGAMIYALRRDVVDTNTGTPEGVQGGQLLAGAGRAAPGQAAPPDRPARQRGGVPPGQFPEPAGRLPAVRRHRHRPERRIPPRRVCSRSPASPTTPPSSAGTRAASWRRVRAPPTPSTRRRKGPSSSPATARRGGARGPAGTSPPCCSAPSTCSPGARRTSAAR